MMFFTDRDRERLHAIDERQTAIDTKLPYLVAAIESHVKWCSRWQFAVACGLAAVLFKLLFPNIHLGG